MVLFIIGALLYAGLVGFIIFKVIKFVRSKPLGEKEIKIDKNLFILLLATILSTGLLMIMSVYGAALWNSWPLRIYEHFLIVIGSYIFGVSPVMFFATFTIYYYKPELIKRQRLILRIIMFSMIPTIIFGLWVMTEGFAAHLTYPLWNAIAIPGGMVNYLGGHNSFFRITFYGIVIVGGALISYFTCDHYFYKKYGKHGLLDVLFLVAFPMGIVGGRLWYCLVLNPARYLADPLTIITGITDGGMAIQGGALLGIVSGIIYMLIFRRYVDLRWAFDTILPTILIAQAIGRWGNFFNCEVHGLPVELSNFWFLPSIIKYQMQYSSVVNYITLPSTQMYLPLFLIEGCLNLGGYFLIRYATKPLNKWLPLLVRGGMYPIWYGLVRIALEPFRTGSIFDTYAQSGGDAYLQSWITAIVMVVGGLLVITIGIVWALVEKKVKHLDHIKTYTYD